MTNKKLDITDLDQDKYYLIWTNPDDVLSVLVYNSPYLKYEVCKRLNPQSPFQIVSCPRFNVFLPKLGLLIDDEGKLKGLDVNTFATYLYGNPFDCIVGNGFIGTLDPPHRWDELDLFALDFNQLSVVCKNYRIERVNVYDGYNFSEFKGT